MTDNKASLYVIIREHICKKFINPPAFNASEESILISMSHNKLPILQSLIVSMAVFLLPNYNPQFIEFWAWVTKKIEQYKTTFPWITSVVLILISLILPWIFCIGKRFYHHLKDHYFVPVLLIAGIAIVCTSTIDNDIDLGQQILGTVIFGICLMTLVWCKEAAVPDTIDKMHRGYFVNRLAEIFSDPNTATKRVAIMGEWGSGKTRILELIAQRLKKDKKTEFKVAFVNPWKAKTVEEAWGLVASSVGEALGHTSIIPKMWATHPLLRNIVELLPFEGVSKHLIQLIFSQGKESRETIIRKINTSLNHFNQRVIVLVDDMERTLPDVLRQLFPIIDQLSDLKGISFVFAIDPNRVASAFSESEVGRNGEITKGYLDKVFDLQIELPQPNHIDIQKMVLEEADRQGALKLVAALPKFHSFLPPNPRLALHFLELALTKERLFLERYSPTEYAYAPFFLCCLIEVEFPGFLDVIQKNLDFDHISYGLWDDDRNDQIRNHETFRKTVDCLKKELGIKEARHERIEKLIEKLIQLCRSPFDRFIEGNGRFTLEWAHSGHTMLTELAHHERMRLCSRWNVEAGKRSIKEMIHAEFSEQDLEFVNDSICSKQLIQFELEQIISAIRNISHYTAKGKLLSLVKGIETSIGYLLSHHQYAREASINSDLESFDECIFSKWIQCIVTSPLTHIDPIIADNINDLRTKLSLELAQSLPVLNAHHYNRQVLQTTLEHHSDERNIKFAKHHFEELKRILTNKVHEYVVKCMKDGTLLNQLIETDITGSDGWNFFYEPKNWLWTDNNEWVTTLEELLTECINNPTLAESIATITDALFVHPSECDNCNNMHVADRQKIKEIQEAYPGYIATLWKASLHLAEDNELKHKIIRTRARAIEKAEVRKLSPDLLKEIFPM